MVVSYPINYISGIRTTGARYESIIDSQKSPDKPIFLLKERHLIGANVITDWDTDSDAINSINVAIIDIFPKLPRLVNHLVAAPFFPGPSVNMNSEVGLSINSPTILSPIPIQNFRIKLKYNSFILDAPKIFFLKVRILLLFSD